MGFALHFLFLMGLLSGSCLLRTVIVMGWLLELHEFLVFIEVTYECVFWENIKDLICHFWSPQIQIGYNGISRQSGRLAFVHHQPVHFHLLYLLGYHPGSFSLYTCIIYFLYMLKHSVNVRILCPFSRLLIATILCTSTFYLWNMPFLFLYVPAWHLFASSPYLLDT